MEAALLKSFDFSDRKWLGKRHCNYLLYVKESHLAYPGFEVEGTEMAELRKHNAIKQDYQLV